MMTKSRLRLMHGLESVVFDDPFSHILSVFSVAFYRLTLSFP